MSDTITQLVQRSFETSGDARFRDIMQSLVRHTHAFVEEVRLTRQEWEAAIGFLTETGKMCTSQRQEFILLSDTLGISTLVEDLNFSASDAATESTVLGPFFVQAAPELASGSNISGDEPGEPLFIGCTVSDEAGAPVPGAVVDVWQSNARGFYDVQSPDFQEHNLRGRFVTDGEGRFWLWSIRPAKYPIPFDGPVGKMLEAAGRHPYRPAHVHFMIHAEGFEPVITQIFDQESEYLTDDAVFGMKPSLAQEIVGRSGAAPDGTGIEGTWRLLERKFVLMRSKAGPA